MVEARRETLVAEERSPMHLCVVIDRSSSMTGRPLSLVTGSADPERSFASG